MSQVGDCDEVCVAIMFVRMLTCFLVIVDPRLGGYMCSTCFAVTEFGFLESKKVGTCDSTSVLTAYFFLRNNMRQHTFLHGPCCHTGPHRFCVEAVFVVKEERKDPAS